MREDFGTLDILIAGGLLLTMDRMGKAIENGHVGIKDGKILFVGRQDRDDTGKIHAQTVIDARRCIVMPGLINTHTHVPMVCFRGFADDLPLMTWLNDYIFPAEARHVSREMVYAGSMLAMAEMILSGTTTFCDSYFYENSVAHAALAAGLRAVVGQGFIDLPTPDIPDPARQVEIGNRFIERWRERSPRIYPALCCHSPYTCSPATLQNVKGVARAAQVPYLVHLAETKDEVALVGERYGCSPVEHLRKLGVLDEGTVAVHCNWLDDDDIETMAACRVAVSHNPESNMKLAAGMARVPSMRERGIRVGLGTDGCASNNDLDMFREMGTTARIHKVIEMNPTVMDAEFVLRMATIDGARVLGLDGEIGSLEAGKWADIIIVDMNKPHLTPLHNGYSQLVYAASGADVVTSIIHGTLVMRDRKLLTMDVEDAMAEVREIARSAAGTRKTG